MTQGFRGLLAQFSMLFQFTKAPPTRTDPHLGGTSETHWFHATCFPGHLPSCPAGRLSVQSSRPRPPGFPGVPSTSAQEEGSPCVLAPVFSLRVPRLMTFAVPAPPEKEAEVALLVHQLHFRTIYPWYLVGFSLLFMLKCVSYFAFSIRISFPSCCVSFNFFARLFRLCWYNSCLLGNTNSIIQSLKSTCSARDLSSIPGLGRLPGEGNGNPL